MSFSFGSNKSKTKSNQKQDPWAPTIPYLTGYLGQVGRLGQPGPTQGQTEAYTNLLDVYGSGTPQADAISNLADETLAGVGSRSGMAEDAYSNLQSTLDPYVSGQYLDPNSNPYLQDMLDTVGNQISERINSMYAGAGRDLSGMNQRAVARGISEGQLPILLNHFMQQQQNQLGAANQLANTGLSTAQVAQGLDQAALSGRAAGVPLAQEARAAEAWGPEQIFNLEQIYKDLPAQDLATIGSLLFPVAQLGQQQEGTSTTKGSSFGFGAKLLSDERMKEDLQQIGTLADGTPIYRFRYKGEDTTRIGLSAQDLEEVTPEAVSEVAPSDASGPTGGAPVKYVDMDAATRRSADMMRDPMGPRGAPGMGAPGMYSGRMADRPPVGGAGPGGTSYSSPMLDYELMRRAA